jgi:hypothetical protein
MRQEEIFNHNEINFNKTNISIINRGQIKI